MKLYFIFYIFFLLNCISIQSEDLADPLYYKPFPTAVPQSSPLPIDGRSSDYGLGFSNPLIQSFPDIGGDIEGGGGTGIGREEAPINDTVKFLLFFSSFCILIYAVKKKKSMR